MRHAANRNIKCATTRRGNMSYFIRLSAALAIGNTRQSPYITGIYLSTSQPRASVRAGWSGWHGACFIPHHLDKQLISDLHFGAAFKAGAYDFCEQHI